MAFEINKKQFKYLCERISCKKYRAITKNCNTQTKPRTGILFVSWLVSEDKGLNEIIELAKYLSVSKQTGEICVVGHIDHKVKSALEKQFPCLNFCGQLSHEELTDKYNEAKCVVYPSYYDNLPSVVIEAIMNGAPVIAYDVGGVSEIIIDGVNGCLIPKGDLSTLVVKVRAVINSELFSDALIKDTLDDDYSNSKIVNKMLSIC